MAFVTIDDESNTILTSNMKNNSWASYGDEYLFYKDNFGKYYQIFKSSGEISQFGDTPKYVVKPLVNTTVVFHV